MLLELGEHARHFRDFQHTLKDYQVTKVIVRECQFCGAFGEPFPYPEETGKANYLSLGEMERRKILTGQREFIHRQKII